MLVTSCCSLKVNYTRNHFSKMINVFATFVDIYSSPEPYDSRFQLRFVAWFDLTPDVLLQFMP